jgi:DNA-damage-inducible protein J
MPVNDQTAGSNPSRKQQKRLKTVGVIVLLLGLAGAGAVYWMGTHSSGPAEDELLPGNARAESRQMGVLYGRMGILISQWSDDLKQPGTQAIIIKIRSDNFQESSCHVAKMGYIRLMSKTATIRARVEPALKSEVEDILEHLGLTPSETVHLLYRQIKLQRGLPFNVRIPNELTARTLNASKAGRGVKRFGSKKELYADLGL